MSYFFSARWPKVELIHIFFYLLLYLQRLHLSLKDNGNKSDFKTRRQEFFRVGPVGITDEVLRKVVFFFFFFTLS